MKPYLAFLFSPYGSVTRLEFLFSGLLVQIIFVMAVGFLLVLFGNSAGLREGEMPAVAMLFAYVFIIFLCMRRCRDIGWSPWVTALLFVPFVSVGFLLAMLLMPSWNSKNGLRYLGILCKRLAEVDGPVNDYEYAAYKEFIVYSFESTNLPDTKVKEIVENSMNFFSKGAANPFVSYEYIAKKLLKKGMPTEDDKLYIIDLLSSLAKADGKVNEKESSLINLTIKLFDLETSMPTGYEYLMGMLAKLAKSDGVVSQEEITLLTSFFDKSLQLLPKQKQLAIDEFNKAKVSRKSFDFYANEFSSIHKDNRSLLELVMGLLLELALADGQVSSEEAILLDSAAEIFNLSADNQSHSSSGQQERYQSKEIEYAKLLGVEVNAPFDEIKSRYRKLIAVNHPDKVAGLSEAIKQAAENETKKIIEAFEYFKQRHKSNTNEL